MILCQRYETVSLVSGRQCKSAAHPAQALNHKATDQRLIAKNSQFDDLPQSLYVLTPRVLPAEIELTYQLILPARSCKKYKSFTMDAATASDALPPKAPMMFDQSRLSNVCAVAPQM
jgi:hypothetical protein